ncbi:MAG: non-canonical purine NTP phosphatase [bacterium]|nr:non-canonical purine NTP phosphatase [bacterium]
MDGVLRVIVASGNPVKIAAVEAAFGLMVPAEVADVNGASVDSGVPDQPLSDLETLRGAEKRAEGAEALRPEADYWVGIEGGIEDSERGMKAFAWVVVRSSFGTGRARSGTFFLPDEVARLVREGKELGEADDIVFGRTDSKQEEGAVGLLTQGVVDRRALYEHAVVLALAPLKHPLLYG